MWPAIRLCLVMTGAFLIQVVVAPHIAIGGVKPNIILIVTALYGFTSGPLVGSASGFLGGLLCDLLVGPNVGLGLISNSIVGFFAGLVQRTIFVENIVLPMLAIFVATWLDEFIYVGFVFLFGNTVPIKVLALQAILPSAIFNAILAPFVYSLVYRFMVVKQDTPSIRIVGKYE